MPEKHQPTVKPLEEGVDHVRGPAAARLIVEYGDYECPYSRQAFRAIERVERQLTGGVRFAFRHFPLTEIHPHALAAAAAAEAAAVQDRFWEENTTYSIRVDHEGGYGWFHYRATAPPRADDIVRVRALPRTDMVGPPAVIDVRITRSEDGEPIAAVELGRR